MKSIGVISLILCGLILFIPAGGAKAFETAAESAIVTVGGDCAIGCTEAQVKDKRGFPNTVNENGFEWPFSGLVETFAEDDLTLVNLEGPLTNARKKVNKIHNFRAPKSWVEILTHGSIEAVNLANNHAYDYGAEGYQDTIDALNEAGITYSGNNVLATYDVRGIKIGMAGYCYPFKNGKMDITDDVNQAKYNIKMDELSVNLIATPSKFVGLVQ